MGLIVVDYTTNEGFLVPQLYIQVNSIRMLKTLQGPNYGMYYSSLAYKSVEDKDSGAAPISIPMYLATAEQYLSADDFYDQTIFGFAYAALKANWLNAGYTVIDYYPQPPTPTTYIYDCSGYNFHGFNCAGYDREGYDKDGYNRQGYDREGYDRQGYDKDGYDRQGYDKDGYDREGYDREGYDKEGYDREGYDREGCNREHVDREGNPCPAPPPPPPDLSGNQVDVSGNTVDVSGNQVDSSGNTVDVSGNQAP